MPKIKWTLNKQLAIPILGLSLFTLAGMTLLSTWKTQGLAKDDAQKKLQLTARSHSNQIQLELESAFAVARLIAAQSESDVKRHQQSRERFVFTLRDTLEKNPQLLSVWMGYEPNAYDSQDLVYKNKPYHEKTGLFIPWWAYSKGELVYETLLSDKTPEMGPWYNVPKQRKKETLVEPYAEEVNGHSVMMTSIVVPILRDGNFVGVSAVDIGLNSIQEQVQKIKPYPGSTAYLVSFDGNYVSTPDRAQLTKKASFLFSSAQILEGIQKGEELQIQGVDEASNTQYYYTVSPLTVGKTERPWALIIRTPSSEVLQAAQETSIFQGIVAVIGIVSLGLTVFLISRRISLKIAAHSAELEKSALTVNHSIEQLSIAGKSLSNSSSSSAAALEETVASLEEMTSMVKMNSDNARQAAQLSKTSTEAAVQGEQEIQALNASMHEIFDASRKIEEIISVIDDIAFQTNLLALNASVEAARAGEQGRGFAVVAEAVRGLAQRSAVAAKDISALIKDSVEKIEQVTEKADSSGEVLKNIVLSVKKVSDLNSEISAAGEEQSVGIQQISKAMSDLDQSVQSNAASSEEIAATSEEIRNQSRLMKQVTVDLKTMVEGSHEDENLNEASDITPLHQNQRPSHSLALKRAS
ncbi:methyl-accepting chemotaxis protein [Bdellovibrio sp. HCB2-146]|uniref:methyl-accepting chemotaxis protein n=1 Tax=Bdellovibrio sp. HCB2-146 TaxID=3394362 RepID=UPI0039BCA51F